MFSFKSEMLEANFSLFWFFLGLIVGVALDYLWRKTGVSKYEKGLEVFEHYHWGLAFLILMRILLNISGIFLSLAGIGISFILAEITQKHPFALKSKHELPSTIIGSILFILLIFTLIS